MIKLQKGQKPPILITNEEAWTTDYVNTINAGLIPTPTQKRRYRHQQIRDTLSKETHGKCAYCESKVGSVTWEHIEHIIPQSVKPELYVKWDNLTLSCPKCNIKKNDNYNDVAPFLNPYEEDFETEIYFRFAGPTIMPILNNARARLSYSTFDLNRIELVEKRQCRILEVDKLLQEWNISTDVIKAAIEIELHDTYSEKQEFRATIKAFLCANGFPVH